jgi:transposase-like protein
MFVKRSEFERLEEKVEELENIVMSICPHKKVVKLNRDMRFLARYKCEVCGINLVEKPKGSKVRMVVYK